MTTKAIDRLRVLWNVYRRIRYFRRMYPVSTIAKDLLLFPLDYTIGNREVRQVRNMTFVITHRCNLRCQMCYFRSELENIHDIPLALYQRAVDTCRKSKPSIQITGGEPFLHPDILHMVRYAKQAGLTVQIFSNGTLVRPDMAEALVDAGLDYMNFTLLGNETSHSCVANVSYAYDKLVSNIDYFARNKGRTAVILNFTLTPQTLKDVEHGFQLARSFRLDGLRIQHYMFLRPSEFLAHDLAMSTVFGCKCVTHEEENSTDVSSMAQDILAIKTWAKERYPDVRLQWAPTLTDSEVSNWYSNERFLTKRQCFFPWRGIQVDADGKIYTCSKIYLELGDLRHDNVLEAWNNDAMKLFRRRLKKSLFPACSRCCKL